MHYRIAAISTLTLVSALAYGNDDGIQGAIMVDELEHRWQEDADDPAAWSVAATVGMDQHSLWLVSEGDHVLGPAGPGWGAAGRDCGGGYQLFCRGGR